MQALGIKEQKPTQGYSFTDLFHCNKHLTEQCIVVTHFWKKYLYIPDLLTGLIIIW